MRTSWGSPSLENFGCSTPPHPSVLLPAKLSVEMGTGMSFGKKKLSNRDSPCRRESWAGRRVLGSKEQGHLLVCQRRWEPDPQPGQPTTPPGFSSDSDTPAHLLAAPQESHSPRLRSLRQTGKYSKWILSASTSCCRNQGSVSLQHGSSQELRAV